jgi:AAA domain
MIPSSSWIDDYQEKSSDWVVDGLIGPYVTALSGQPKVGKSTFVTQIALAVVNQTPFLGREIKSKSNKVAWMGYDAGWVFELKDRCGDNAKNSILLQRGIPNVIPKDWDELGQHLYDLGIGLLIIDHLYGFAGSLTLNDSQEAFKVITCLNAINGKYGIPIILIAQAPKTNNSAGMAHSNILKSSARVLLEMSGTSRAGKRSLVINGNEVANERIAFRIEPRHIELIDKEVEKESKQVRDYQAFLDKTRKFFSEARNDELLSIPKAAPVLIRLGISRTQAGAEKMLSRWRDKKLIEVSDSEITPGDNCFA